MGRMLVIAILTLGASTAPSGQSPAVLHLRVELSDSTGQPAPLARYALLISDEPQTRETRRIVTRVDGTADVRLLPGTYVIESDEPVARQGQAYHWRHTLVIVAGRDASLDLTMANVVVEPLTAGAPGTDAPLATDTSILLRQWLDSVVEIWTPTSHASGFLVDAAGLVATNQRVIGDATTVEVQISRTIKVAGTVLEADSQLDLAVIQIDPLAMASMSAVPLGCSPGNAPPVVQGEEIFALAAPLRQEKDWTVGTVSRVDARTIETDLSLATGGTGGPVFTGSGEFVGITTLPDARDEPVRGTIPVARVVRACDLVAAAKTVPDRAAPSGAHLPVEPAEPSPVATFKDAVTRRTGSLSPYQLQASDFDVAFITPVLNYAAQARPDQTFANWSDYVAEIPPVLFVRVTPRMTEGFWAKLARGAAFTQGMALPPLTRLTSGFERLQAFCGATEVTPIHPFKLELRVSQTEAIYEGLYAFDPKALGPECSSVTLVLYSSKEPAKPDTRVVTREILDQVWRDFELGAGR